MNLKRFSILLSDEKKGERGRGVFSGMDSSSSTRSDLVGVKDVKSKLSSAIASWKMER